MCGIVGIVRAGPLHDGDLDRVRDATTALEHRGPDGEGFWNDEHAAFGHRRLSIVDLEGGRQPMEDDSGRYWITYNGELYNHAELRKELEAKGRQFRTQSDTETVLNAFAEWGESCLDRFDGIFAFGIWDRRERSLFLARDALGVKPLYVHATGEHVLFASELKAILPLLPSRPEIDDYALSDYLSLGYVLAPRSIYKNVQKLDAATWLRFRSGTLLKQRYWHLDQVIAERSSSARTIQKEAPAFLERLRASVKSQLMSDVPLGSFLSGGIDSCAITLLAAQEVSNDLCAYSMGFEQKAFNELDYANIFLEHTGIRGVSEIVENHGASVIEQLPHIYDEPYADSSATPTVQLCRMASRHVKVALSGDGGDEVLSGYETYRADRLQRGFRFLAPLAGPALSCLCRLSASQAKVAWDYKARVFLRYLGETPERAHYGWRELFREDEKRIIMGPDRYAALDGYTPFDVFDQHYKAIAGAHPVHQSLYVDIKTWLADDILVKMDRAGMAHGLEVRVPFLQTSLVEYCLSLPPDYLMKGLQTKAILREAMKPHLPKDILYRKKRGFNAPVAFWIHDKWDELNEPSPDLALPQQWLNDLRSAHTQKKADHGFRLWVLAQWAAWSRSWR